MGIFRKIGEAIKDFGVFSEVTPLTSVLIHEPGKEIEKVTPESFKEKLFDDVLPLKLAQQHHEIFVEALNGLG